MFGGFNTPLFLNLDASKKNCYFINVSKKKPIERSQTVNDTPERVKPK